MSDDKRVEQQIDHDSNQASDRLAAKRTKRIAQGHSVDPLEPAGTAWEEMPSRGHYDAAMPDNPWRLEEGDGNLLGG